MTGGEVGARRITRREGDEVADEPAIGIGGGGESGGFMSGMLDSVGKLALTIPCGTSSCSSRSWTESTVKMLATLSRLLLGTAGKDIRRNGRYGGRDSRTRSCEGARDAVGLAIGRAGEEERGARGEVGDSGSVAMWEDLGVDGADPLDWVGLNAGKERGSIWRRRPRVFWWNGSGQKV